MNLKHIQLFLALAQHQSLTKAAEAVCMSQPAASLGLSSLEGELGVKLFDRIGRNIIINDNGQRFYAHAEALALQTQRCQILFKSQAEQPLQGKLVIGASNTICNYYLPKRLAEFNKTHSDVEIHLLSFNTQEVVEALLKHKIDVGYIEGYCSDGQLMADVVHHERLVLVSSVGHPLANAETIELSDLDSQKWCLRELGSGTRQVTDALLAQHKVAISSTVNLSSNEAILNYTRESDVLACVPKKILDYVHNDGLKILSVNGLEMQRQIVRLIHRDKHISDVVSEWNAFAHYW